MKLKTFYCENKTEDAFILQGNELNHAVNVYRLKTDDYVNIICGDEFIYNCKIATVNKKEAVCEIANKEKCLANPKKTLTVFQCNLKSDKIEFLCKALTEIGATELCVVNSENVVKDVLRADRLSQIAIEAAKQCGRSSGVIVADVINFKDLLTKLKNYDKVFVAHEKEEKIDLAAALKNADKLNKVACIIGPEGGLSDSEVASLIDYGVEIFGLNKRILRAETACISISSIILYAMGENKL